MSNLGAALQPVANSLQSFNQPAGSITQGLTPWLGIGAGAYDFAQRQNLFNQMSPQNIASQARKLINPQEIFAAIEPVMGNQMGATGNATPGLFGRGVGQAVGELQLQAQNQVGSDLYSQLLALGQPPDLAGIIASATGGSLTGTGGSSGKGADTGASLFNTDDPYGLAFSTLGSMGQMNPIG